MCVETVIEIYKCATMCDWRSVLEFGSGCVGVFVEIRVGMCVGVRVEICFEALYVR